MAFDAVPDPAVRLMSGQSAAPAPVTGGGAGTCPRTGRHDAVAARLPAAADRYFLERYPARITNGDLCRVLAVSEKQLRKAFLASRGVAPKAYFKQRRLEMARTALIDGGPGVPLVKCAALAHGFRHFGQFARDYHDLFGELPSQTHASARRRHTTGATQAGVARPA